MTKRTILIMLGAFAMAGTLQAEPLTPEQALKRAQSQNGLRRNVAALNDCSSAVPAYITYGAEDATSYVFAGKKGWTILSADDMAPAVLGYSDNGIFDPDNIPANMRAWLESYSDQIEWMRKNASFAPSAISEEAEDGMTRTAIEPLVTTKWNQDSPYNDMLPKLDGMSCVTGCVATAMAQIMNYYEWPAVGSGTHSYALSDGTTLSIDFAEHPFDWDNMADIYNAKSTEAQNKAVADLMYTCGVAINSGYGTSATGAYTSDVVDALINNFDYSEGIGLAKRQYYTADEWEQLIYDQLSNYGPVLYGGVTSGGAGHQFVCDGYREDGYFHINWGWGGLSDGYYLLSILAPSMQGIGGSAAGYNFSQDAMINVKPRNPEAATEPWTCLGMIGSFVTNQTATNVKIGNYYASNSSYTRFINWGNEDVTFDTSFLVEGKTVWGNDTVFTFGGSKGSDVSRLDQVLKAYKASNNWPYYSTAITGYIPAMSDGVYTVCPAYRLKKVGDKEVENTVWSKFKYCPSVPSYYTWEVSNGAIISYAQQEFGVPQVVEYSFETPLYLGRTFVVKAKLRNTTETEFYGDLAGFFFNSTATLDAPGNPAYRASATRLSVRPGETVEVEYSIQFNHQVGDARDYQFAFVARPYTLDSNSSTYWLISEMKPISSSIAPYGTVAATSSINFDGNPNCMPKDKLDFSIDVKCIEGTYYNTVDFYIYEFEEYGTADEEGGDDVADADDNVDSEITEGDGDDTGESLEAPANVILTENGQWVRKYPYYSPYLRLLEGESQTVEMHLPFDGEIGKQYGLKVFSTWIPLSDMMTFTLGDNSSAYADLAVMSTDNTPVPESVNEDGSITEDALNFSTNITVTEGAYSGPVDFVVKKWIETADETGYWELYATVQSEDVDLAAGESETAKVQLVLPVDCRYGVVAFAGPCKLNDAYEFVVVSKPEPEPDEPDEPVEIKVTASIENIIAEDESEDVAEFILGHTYKFEVSLSTNGAWNGTIKYALVQESISLTKSVELEFAQEATFTDEVAIDIPKSFSTSECAYFEVWSITPDATEKICTKELVIVEEPEPEEPDEPVLGIGSLNSNDGAVRYFNLQGIEVCNPQPGQMLIRICGNTVNKVVVK